MLDARYPAAFKDVRDDMRDADEAERDAFFSALAEEEEEDASDLGEDGVSQDALFLSRA